MRSSACIIILVLTAMHASAQNVQSIHCGNDIFSDIVRTHYPALGQSFQSTFDGARNTSTRYVQDPLVVNVVVHIVWKEPGENLHDSIILDQISILNKDFNRLNADTAQLRDFFKPVAGTSNIEFVLADIIRVQTDQEFDVDILGMNLLPEVKHTADGGSDAWNTEEFLNIWVCHIQPIEIFGIPIGQILGFAFPPNNLGNWPPDVGAPTPEEDGVVIDYRVFGSNNPNEIEIPGGGGILTVKGRTPVHEVGHYLGLRHIWGDGGLLGPNDCAQSDGIDDTPYADAQSAFDCDTLKNSCTGIDTFFQIDAPDLIENYMDYASEDCMNMFTHGQVDLMRNVLLGPRVGLLGPASSVQVSTSVDFIHVIPNPAHDAVTIQNISPDRGELTVRLRDLRGVPIIHDRRLNAQESIQIDIRGLLPGLYILEVRKAREVLFEKVLIQ